jgi:hypothetical protein
MVDASNPLQLLEVFEYHVYARRTAEATRSLLRLLARLLLLNDSEGLLPARYPAALRQAVYTRIAAACTTLVTDPAFAPSPEQFREFCVYKVVLHNVFSVSGFNDATHLGMLLCQRQSDGSLTLSGDALAKLALFSALDDLPAPIFEEVLKLPASTLLPLLLGWMRQRAVLTTQGERNRARLLESGGLVETVSLSDDMLALLVSAWMYCSYASHPNKHAIKQPLNQLIRNWMQAKGIHASCSPRAIKDKPTLVIVGESLRVGHAMFRCYAEKIRQLREHFRLVLVAPSAGQDPVVRGYFDDCVEVSRQPDELADTVAKIEALSPDLIYYPSVGMTFLSIALANLRLAPIQFMTVGHPATSMSDCMDYVILGGATRESADSFREVAVVRPGQGYYEPHSALSVSMPKRKKEAGGVLDVAVNGIAMKLSCRLIDVCERLRKESSRSLIFHFFPGEKGVRQDGIRSLLTRRFPDAVVHPYLPYAEYLEKLGGCDLVLAPFPFGNTNCTVDASILGLPVVAFFGPEPHSQTDRGIMRKLELPSWLVGENDADYYQAALRLITNDRERMAIQEHLRGIDVHKKLFSLAEGEDARTFYWAVRWMYQNHENMIASDRRVWDGLYETF